MVRTLLVLSLAVAPLQPALLVAAQEGSTSAPASPAPPTPAPAGSAPDAITPQLIGSPGRPDENNEALPESLLELAGQISLARLLDIVSTRAKVSVEYDPALLTSQRVALRSDGQTTAEVWQLANRQLVQHGLTTVRTPEGDGFAVVSITDAARLARREPPIKAGKPLPDSAWSLGPSTLAPGYVRQPVELTHLAPAQAMALLRPSRSAPTSATVPVSSSASTARPKEKAATPLVVPPSDDELVLADLTPAVREQLARLATLDRADQAFEVHTLSTEHLPPAALMAALGPLLGRLGAAGAPRPTGELALAPEGDSLVLVAPRGMRERWVRLISTLDAPPPPQRATYTPRSGRPAQVAAVLNELIAAELRPSVQIIPDDASGAIVVVAPAHVQGEIRSAIERLDAAGTTRPQSFRTFRVVNRDAQEVVTSIRRLLATDAPDGSGSPSTSDAARPGEAAGLTALVPPQGGLIGDASARRTERAGAGANAANPPGQGPPPRSARAGFVLTSDQATSTILASGEPAVLDEVAALIEALDTREPQVMLEVLIVSLTDADTLSLGVELERLRVDGAVRVRLASLFGLSSGGTSTGRDAGQGAGFTGAVIDPGEFSVIVKAAQAVSTGRTLTMPRVLVTNNKPASFNSVVQQPFAASFTAGNSSSPTTSFGGTQDAGTQLSITPQIGRGDVLTLDYDISISAFTGAAASSNLPPPRQVTSVRSIAQVPDGHSVVVGGLEVSSDGTSATQVPLLGDIPLVGSLFKSQSRGVTRSRFFIFIRPSVFRGTPIEALRFVSDRARHDSGVHPASAVGVPWPTSEPEVIR